MRTRKMNTVQLMTRVCVTALILSLTVPAVATVIVDEQFNDNDLANTAADAKDMAWFEADGNSQFSLGARGGLTAPSLRFQSGDGGMSFVAVMDTTAMLGNLTGDQLRLSVNYSMNRPAKLRSEGFRFGLFNSNGTVVDADFDTDSQDDYGYYVSHATYSSGSAKLFEEASDSAWPVSSGSQIASSTSGHAINTSSYNSTMVLNLTRNADGGIDFAYYADQMGNLDPDDLSAATARITGSDNDAPISSFDALAFKGDPDGVLLYLDDVKVQTIAIPEPMSMLLLGLGGGLGLLRRRW